MRLETSSLGQPLGRADVIQCIPPMRITAGLNFGSSSFLLSFTKYLYLSLSSFLFVCLFHVALFILVYNISIISYSAFFRQSRFSSFSQTVAIDFVRRDSILASFSRRHRMWSGSSPFLRRQGAKKSNTKDARTAHRRGVIDSQGGAHINNSTLS